MADDQELAAADSSAEGDELTLHDETMETAEELRCAGPGCANALPGRSSRAKYCSDACRAAAYRARTASHAAPVANALLRAQGLLGPLLAAGEQWQAAQAALSAQLTELSSGALAQVQAAEQAAEEARAAAAAADQRAAAADQRATTIANTAAAHVAAAEQAQKQAETARDRAEEREQDAWRQVGEHQNARSQAEQRATEAIGRQRQAEQHRDTARHRTAELTELHTAATARVADLERQATVQQHDLTDLRRHLQEQEVQTRRAEQERDQARGTAAAHAAEADRLREALIVERQQREQAVTAAAVAEQARTLADQSRTASLSETERLRTELTDLANALKTAQQQREEAVTAAAVAHALLRQQQSARVSDQPEAPDAGDSAEESRASDS
ncbi:hypothetical protein [Nonomuraea sp. NPDC049607]|uniref:hypothetical protein n=1 Tax=Nonomuraea sp. NPDC049607 TaxID=3154732 RepID=UPI00341ECBE6